jgi:hypothetical protein
MTPYIKKDDRKNLDPHIELLVEAIQCGGDYNYVISRLFILLGHKWGISYETFRGLLGDLEGAKQEMYRQVVAPYEDVKIELNGHIKYWPI